MKSSLLVLAALVLAAPLRADLNADLAFTAFQNVDVNALAGGTVLQARGPIMAFPRGITSQSLFIIDAQPGDVAKKLTTWNPVTHPELQVWFHKSLGPNPTVASLADLASLPDNKSVQFQIDATAKFNPSSPSLQVSREEAQLIAATAAQQKDPKALYAKVWSQIIMGRVQAFMAGKGGTSYDTSDIGDIHTDGDVRSLLHSDPKVYIQYAHLFNQTPLRAKVATPGPYLPPADVYCDMFDVEGSAALGTGAIYQAASGNSIQSLDTEYYCNYGVYVTIELEQMWPISVGGKTETLVWREDLVSAPNVAYLHGTERLASSMIMLQETKGGVDAFRAEFK
jgi:hypothetical protein